MKYICTECGKVFDEDDVIYEEEYRGEYWGVPAYETESYSPCCHEPIDDFDPTCEYCQFFTKDCRCSYKGIETEKNDICEDFELSEQKEY